MTTTDESLSTPEMEDSVESGEVLKPAQIKAEQTVVLTPESVDGLKIASIGNQSEAVRPEFIREESAKEKVGTFGQNGGYIAYVPAEGQYAIAPATRENITALELAGYKPGEAKSNWVLLDSSQGAKFEGSDILAAKSAHMEAVLAADQTAREVEKLQSRS